jgi:hypothetical protein
LTPDTDLVCSSLKHPSLFNASSGVVAHSFLAKAIIDNSFST